MVEQALMEKTLHVNGLTLDVEKAQVTGPNGTYHLTPMENRLLEIFLIYSGQVIRRAFLMRTVWQTDYLDDTRTLDVHISWLRKKIEADPRHPHYLRTIRGVGYWFRFE